MSATPVPVCDDSSVGLRLPICKLGLRSPADTGRGWGQEALLDEQVLALSAVGWGRVSLALGAALAPGHCWAQSGHSPQVFLGREEGRMQSVALRPWAPLTSP